MEVVKFIYQSGVNMDTHKNILDCLINIGCIVDSMEANLADVIENSIMFITFIVELEERFKIEFPDEYLIIEKFNTIESVVDLVEELSCENRQEL